MTINDLELYCVEIERTGAEAPARSLLTRLATDSGMEGWGESPIAWQPVELPGRRDALLSLLRSG